MKERGDAPWQLFTKSAGDAYGACTGSRHFSTRIGYVEKD
jgi:hypothetical protein